MNKQAMEFLNKGVNNQKTEWFCRQANKRCLLKWAVKRTNKEMNKLTNEQMNEQVYERANEQVSEQAIENAIEQAIERTN